LYGLDELTLSAVALIDHDRGGGLDLGLLLLSGLLTLNGILSVEALLQGGVSVTDLLLGQTGADDTLQLAFGVSASTTLDGGQSQLERGGRDDRVLIVVLLFGLLVQFGGQMNVGLFQFLQQLVFGLALVALLLLTASLLSVLGVSVGVFGFVLFVFSFLLSLTEFALEVILVAFSFVLVIFVVVVIVVQVQAAVALTTRALLTLLVIFVVLFLESLLVLIDVEEIALATRTAVALLLLLLLLALQRTQQTLELASIRIGLTGESHGQAQSNQE
jgi:hypothetical protein